MVDDVIFIGVELDDVNGYIEIAATSREEFIAQGDGLGHGLSLATKDGVKLNARTFDLRATVQINVSLAEIVRQALDGIGSKSNHDVDRPRALRLDKDHERIFDENPEVVVGMLGNHALARNCFDIRLADLRIFGVKCLVHL